MPVKWRVAIALATVAPASAQSLPDHAGFAVVLEAVWHDGLIDYGALHADRAPLDAYLAELAKVSPAALDAAPHATQLALWINAYNACTLRRIVDHYPIARRGGVTGLVHRVRGLPANSIRQIPDPFTAAFCPVAGRTRSLDEIEHEIIRPMGDPRIHFAVNCAARSCPRLAPTPYTAAGLDAELDAAVRTFVAAPTHYRLERGDPPVVVLNKVLDWYQDDFGGREALVAFLAPYLPAADRAYLDEHGPARVAFADYDWTLNDTAVSPVP